MPRHVRQSFVEMRDRIGKLPEHRRAIAAADKQSTRVAQDAVHVADQLVRRANLWPRHKAAELRRRATKRLLRPVSQCSQKMPEQCTLFIHLASTQKPASMFAQPASIFHSA